MSLSQPIRQTMLYGFACLLLPASAYANPLLQQTSLSAQSHGLLLAALVAAGIMFLVALYLLWSITRLNSQVREQKKPHRRERFRDYLNLLNSEQIQKILRIKKLPLLAGLLLYGSSCFAQQTTAVRKLINDPGIIITILLIMLPLLAGIAIMAVKVLNLLQQQRNENNRREAGEFANYLQNEADEETLQTLRDRQAALDYRLSGQELTGSGAPKDNRGLITYINHEEHLPFFATKKKAIKRPDIDTALSRLVVAFIVCATAWLVIGTSVGEYVGIKFVSPDADHISWLSFGRLRPVHTNTVFWGWASLAMLGLGYYIIPTVSNTKLYSIKWGWYALILINLSVITGNICLMAGINNAGGEYREYTWLVMALFGIGLALTLANFFKTIARRTTHEIYISGWYIVAAIMFALVITLVAYLPWWQNGLGETIVQGYYMHMGVGMWFMFFTLGIVYYFLPQQLNKPIYSYSLGILAFWAQIFFYTVIGTHHFVFISIPWWLQTTAIVGSIGMIIPVGAGFTNFIMTFKGMWHKVADSYTLPFFLTGIVFYLTGSLQGTAEAFRSTNLLWHFTDFTVAHSHLTMYGIICFFAWAAIYAVLPRLTGKEAPHATIGAHFWLALVGLLFYTIPLMYGSTLRGLLWMDGKPFIESVVLMAPYWLWRAIGGSLMWLSHLFFAYNIYKMLDKKATVDIAATAVAKLEKEYQQAPTPIQ